ncbi:histidinol dehydrogenase [Legionella rubrilucens]|uniref:Histidinol dehydrogenase n=1 Tax=Legionella rubrilucens TaxID=458 RepID=A0A0W0Y1A2_9GAMM|nr:histidinol dehydrogenase [Legionella rubrilucens]KTD50597.1 histidinol dehydrogenase [Legionella rubrilucens]
MLSIYTTQSLSMKDIEKLFTRPLSDEGVESAVRPVLNAVRKDGDEAVMAFTREFDGIEVNELTVLPEEMANARIDGSALAAIQTAMDTIRGYHEAVKPETKRVSTAPGIWIERQYRPIQRVGLYIPGGNNTPLISSLLMQAIPAAIAGCPLKIVCTPPDRFGRINPHVLVAARLCGIDAVYKAGGAQAIAAMAYGTQSIPKVDKLFGPGNRYVTEAKRLVSMEPMGPAIDMPAGPSEVLIVADDEANPDFVAADLLAQAEHGVDSQSILLCASAAFAEAVNQSLIRQMQSLKRQAIIRQSLKHSFALVTASREQTIRWVNAYAPEHLIINCRDAADWVSLIQAAGTVFLGPWAAETLGDYVTGSNHVLPTNGYARHHNGLSTEDFLTRMTVQTIDPQGIVSVGEAACVLASLEGLDAHANAVKMRLTTMEV